MNKYCEMMEEATAGQTRMVDHVAMDETMRQAANENGINKADLASFLSQVHQQNSNAHATLGADLQASNDAAQKRAEAQATALAQEMATHTKCGQARRYYREASPEFATSASETVSCANRASAHSPGNAQPFSRP